jgi:hypothetical protein
MSLLDELVILGLESGARAVGNAVQSLLKDVEKTSQKVQREVRKVTPPDIVVDAEFENVPHSGAPNEKGTRHGS